MWQFILAWLLFGLGGCVMGRIMVRKSFTVKTSQKTIDREMKELAEAYGGIFLLGPIGLFLTTFLFLVKCMIKPEAV